MINSTTKNKEKGIVAFLKMLQVSVYVCLLALMPRAGLIAQEIDFLSPFLTGLDITDLATTHFSDDICTLNGVMYDCTNNNLECSYQSFLELHISPLTEDDMNLSMYQAGMLYTMTVSYEIEYLDANGIVTSGSAEDISAQFTLDGGVFNNKAVRLYDHKYYLGVKVTAVDVTGVSVDGSTGNTQVEVPTSATLRTGAKVNRYIPIDLGINGNPINITESNGYFYFDMPMIEGAQSYDLEWTWVDDELINGEQPTFDFKRNSTRINSLDPVYKVSNIYRNGVIVARYRGVGHGSESADCEKLVYGQWNIVNDTGMLGSLLSNRIDVGSTHRVKFNWQHSRSYAEEGKFKDVINYFDGSLRSRQTLSKLESDQHVIVTESIYDHIGRPVIQVLPSPVIEANNDYKTNIDFVPNLTKVGVLEVPYSYEHFEIESGGADCGTEAMPLSTSSGSSKYYSPNNIVDEVGKEQDYVPDAEQFPFSQTLYTQDGTGRVRFQGGVGKTHQIFGGHDTKYYYGVPSQNEIDRLFGIEAGYAKYYHKNLVVDPNGQVSVSYLDNKNRVIATALAGNNPDGILPLTSLASIAAFQDVNDISDKNVTTIGLNNRTLGISHQQLIEENGTEFKVDYTFDKLDFTYSCVPDICFDCVYELKLAVVDDCGALVMGSNDNIIVNHSADDSATDCQTGGPEEFMLNLVDNLDVKNYSVSKVLTLDGHKMKEYEELYVDSDECITSLEEAFSSLLLNVDLATCGNDQVCVDACVNGLSIDDFDDIADYREALLDCINECPEGTIDPTEGGNICDDLLEGMLLDVSPFGTYGGISVDVDGAIEVGITLDASGNLIPVDLTSPQCLSMYYESTDFSTLISTTANTPALFQNVDFKEYDQVTGAFGALIEVEFMGQTVNPSELPLPIFIDLWEDDWAYSMIEYHPEYPSYQWCSQESIDDALNYELKIQNIETFEEARMLGYLRPTGISASIIEGLVSGLEIAMNESPTIMDDDFLDPLFLGSNNDLMVSLDAGNGGTLQMSLYQLAYISSVSNIVDMEAVFAQYQTGASNANIAAQIYTLSSDIITMCNYDRFWVVFRDLYLQLIKRPALSLSVASFISSSTAHNDIVDKLGADCDNCTGVECDNCEECPSYGIIQQRFSFFNTIQETTVDLNMTLEEISDDVTTGIEGDITSTCATNCASYRPEWEREYANCMIENPTGNYTELFDVFEAMCAQGCDVEHIMGSSTLPSTNGYTYNGEVFYSFEDAHLFIIGTPTAQCNALLIEAPLSYESDPFVGEMPLIDDCVCDKYNHIYDQYELTGEASFEAYLTENYNYDPEQYNITDLDCVCRASNALFFVDVPVNTGPIPPVFACKECVTCPQMIAIVDQFNDSEYAGLFGAVVGPLHEDEQFRIVFTNWVNQELNFNLTFIEYLDYVSYCGVNFDYNDVANLVILTDKSTISLAQNLTGANLKDGEAVIRRSSSSVLEGQVEVSVQLMPDVAEAGDDVSSKVVLKNLTSTVISDINLSVLIPAGWTYEDINALPVGAIDGFNTSLVNASNISLAADETVEYIFQSSVPENIYLARNYYTSATISQGENDTDPIVGDGAVYVDIPDPCINGVETSDDMTLFLNEVFAEYRSMLINGENPCEGIPLSEIASYASSSINMTPFISVDNQSVTVCASDLDGEGDGDDYTFIFMNTCTNTMSCDLVIYDIEDLDHLYDADKGKFQIKAIENAFNLDFTVEHELEVEYLDSRYDQILTLEATSADCFSFEPCDRRLLCNRSVSIPVGEDEDGCINSILDVAQMQANYVVEEETNESRATFRREYVSQCLNEDNLNEEVVLTKNNKEYHHTLYYYDQSGSLVKTIPPKGVKELDAAQAKVVSEVRNEIYIGTPDENVLYPPHQLPTKYKYNSFGQIDEQKSPDLDVKTRYWYDRLGRPVISQDGRQEEMSDATHHVYSYTLYDKLGRITEVGEMTHAISFDVVVADPSSSYDVVEEQDVIDFVMGTTDRQNIIRSIYDTDYVYDYDNQSLSTDAKFDLTPTEAPAYERKYLRKRISSSLFIEDINLPYNYATHYDYDIHGNVKTILQEYRELEGVQHNLKRIDYDYDLISGNVHQVAYQEGHVDQLYHEYEYDADNRIISARTSKDGFIWDTDASYTYYDHGPLARTDLGQYNVQGCDYIYTIHGWIKAVNATNLNEENDPGNDGYDAVDLEHANVANDAYAFSLHYYDEDYKGIRADEADFAGTLPTQANSPEVIFNQEVLTNLYNGNISKMSTALRGLDNVPLEITPNNYVYDQLHRLRFMKKFEPIDLATFSWGGALTDSYGTRYDYDPNGNLLNLRRRNAAGEYIDRLTYFYPSVFDPNSTEPIYTTNRLNFAGDSYNAGDDNNFQGQNYNNYQYDKSGNMISDNSEEISEIIWDQYGKIRHIDRENGPTTDKPEIDYHYDAMGNRISKVVDDGTAKIHTYYVRDASGNVMALYKANEDNDGVSEIFKKEHHIYGSSRLGIKHAEDPTQDIAGSTEIITETYERTRTSGNRSYELTNHLSNVLSTVSDNKLLSVTGPNIYQPEILNFTDYYPFGWGMPGRTGTHMGHRYGFNGKEMDNNVKGEGVQYDYGFRIYDSRIARFLSVDPLTASYPWYTPYQFAGNKPIVFVDLDGLEEADPQQLADAQQYFKKTKLQQSVKFKHITPDMINRQVRYRLASLGDEINQGKFHLCGPAAAAHVAISHDPKSYVETVFNLYMEGFANGKAIKGNNSIYNAEPDGNWKIDGIDAVDWIVLNSLRYSENLIDLGSYDPHKTGEDLNKATRKSEFSDLIQRLGANVNISESGSIGDAEWGSSDMEKWVESGKHVVLFVDSRQYSRSGTGTYESWLSQQISTTYGRHFIVVKGFEIQEGGKVKVDFWHIGKSTNVTKIFDNYEDFDSATMNFWFMENGGNKND